MNNFAKTNIGKHRESNQDAVLIKENSLYNFYILCDGMGGVKGGNLASKLCLSTIEKEFSYLNKKLSEEEMKEWMYNSIIKANEEINKMSKKDATFKGMGTTVVLLMISDSYRIFASVGDSRIYTYQKNKLNQISEDQTYVAALLRAGFINEKEAKNHPNRSMILCAVGTSSENDLDVEIDTIEKGNNFLLCSDGLYNMVEDKKILEELNKEISVEEKVNNLIDLANKNGGFDNISVILVEE